MKVKIKKLVKKAVIPHGSSTVKCAFCGKEEVVPNSRAIGYKYCSRKCMRNAYISHKVPMVGERINKWEVIDSDIIRKYGRRYVMVKCTCGSGIEKLLPYHHYIDKKSKGCCKCSKFFTNKGYGDISGSQWGLIKSSALKRNISFDITIEYAWDLFLKQNKCCALSGVELAFAPTSMKCDKKYQTASLDRIDSSKGYIVGNVQWVHKDYNIMKNRFSQKYFNDFIIHAASKVQLKVKIKRLTQNSVIPQYAKNGDAGLDLTAASIEQKGDKIIYHCGLAFEIPEGYFGLVVPRSSNAKKDLLLTNSVGIIDSGYRGEITAVFQKTRLLYTDLYNVGDRFAQLIILPYPQIEFEEVEELSKTERGIGGYGSSGK